jgi:hypothetical protein
MRAKDNGPADRFVRLMDVFNSEMAALQSRADNHFGKDPDELNWGDVGDLTKIVELLKQANGKEE